MGTIFSFEAKPLTNLASHATCPRMLTTPEFSAPDDPFESPLTESKFSSGRGGVHNVFDSTRGALVFRNEGRPLIDLDLI